MFLNEETFFIGVFASMFFSPTGNKIANIFQRYSSGFSQTDGVNTCNVKKN